MQNQSCIQPGFGGPTYKCLHQNKNNCTADIYFQRNQESCPQVFGSHQAISHTAFQGLLRQDMFWAIAIGHCDACFEVLSVTNYYF